MATFEKLIREMPIPSDWNKRLFVIPGDYTERNFYHALVYAKEHGTYLARGSSRAVFEITYEGRRTVLKMAMNQAGLAQNAEDIKVIFGAATRKNQVVVPGIDYDTESSAPLWIHQEYAGPLDEIVFQNKYGFRISEMVAFAKAATGTGYNQPVLTTDELQVAYPEVLAATHSPALDLVMLVHQMKVAGKKRTFLRDISGSHNWGICRGKYVIVDFGYSDEVAADFYSGGGPREPHGPGGTSWHPSNSNTGSSSGSKSSSPVWVSPTGSKNSGT